MLARHGRKLWWLHSAYALTLGVGVVIFANRGFARARWLAVSIISAWLLVVASFRLFGGRSAEGPESVPHRGLRREAPQLNLRFGVLSYVLRNLYQGMLFFLLPFYWKGATFWAPNVAFVFVLAVVAVLSTLDVVFDEVVMRNRVLVSVLHGFTLFASLELLVPALLPQTRSLVALLAAATITVLAFFTLHVPPRQWARGRTITLLVLSAVAGSGLAYAARTLVPPVPMHLAHGAVGPYLLGDGRLVMEVKSLHTSAIRELVVVTDVAIPSGEGDELHHVWRHEGIEVHRERHPSRTQGPRETLRLASMLGPRGTPTAPELRPLPKNIAGAWAVDVETKDGQLVGRVAFHVID